MFCEFKVFYFYLSVNLDMKMAPVKFVINKFNNMKMF